MANPSSPMTRASSSLRISPWCWSSSPGTIAAKRKHCTMPSPASRRWLGSTTVHNCPRTTSRSSLSDWHFSFFPAGGCWCSNRKAARKTRTLAGEGRAPCTLPCTPYAALACGGRAPHDVTRTTDAGISLDFSTWLGYRLGRQIIRPYHRGGSVERSAAGFVFSLALWPPVSAKPRRFFPALERADGGGDPGSTHLWMEDPVCVSCLVVAASHNVS